MNKFRELHDELARPTVPEARNSWGSANGGGFGGLGLSHVALSHEWANNAAARQPRLLRNCDMVAAMTSKFKLQVTFKWFLLVARSLVVVVDRVGALHE